MRKQAIIIAGIPGTGKTTLMKNVIKKLEQHGDFENQKLVKLIPSMFHKERNLHILGLYDDSDDVFQGTDKLSMACQPEFDDFLNKIDGADVLFEGDRLLTGKTIDTLQKFNYNIRIVVLTTAAIERDRRYEERGSNQNKKFINSRQTKIDRLSTRFDLLGYIDEYENNTMRDSEDIAVMVYKFVLTN
tara:strand:- start:889 stop:1452 length:564 start_codon:yes stop_codon:yes gene_type:complete